MCMKGNTVKLLVLFVTTLAALGLTTGCGGPEKSRELTLGNIGWDENVAISNLTKVLLEDELGYERVEIRKAELRPTFQAVATGDLDAFQDVWLPNQKALLGEVAEDVEQLEPWYLDTTEQGIAVPAYMDVTSIDQLNETDADQILGIEPSAVVMQVVADEVIPKYGLKQKLVEASTEGMLAEVEQRYSDEEAFVFLAWSPHWMNQRYDFRYLEDPEDALGDTNDPAQITMIVNEDLPDDDPVAYAFLQALTLTEEQVNNLEGMINEAGDPLVGARQWARDNRGVVQPWIEAANNAQEP